MLVVVSYDVSTKDAAGQRRLRRVSFLTRMTQGVLTSMTRVPEAG